jgi:polysaccharide export outer membrane protein
MKILSILFATLLLQTAYAESYQYEIHSGDVLSISIWNEDSLQRELQVLPDGTISFPLAGVIIVEGKALKDIQNELIKKLADFIPDAEVNVSVKSVSGNSVYVIGQVKKPGQFIMLQPMDVMQILSLAGGLTAFAKANDILILRRKNGVSDALEFRYGDVEDGDNLEKNYLLKTGDVIVVP